MQTTLDQSLAKTKPTTLVVLERSTYWLEGVASIFSFPAMCLFLIGLAIFRICTDRIAEPDIWWHLRNASYLFEHHHLPRVDMYSFGAAGTTWINHEWLSEVPFYFGFKSFGLQGLLAVYFVVILLIFAGVYYRAWRNGGNCKNAAVVTLFGLLLAIVSIGPRMLLFGWLCMVVLLMALDSFRLSGKGMWVLPPLFGLWINLHGSWVYGIVVVLVTVISGLVEGTWGRVKAQRWSRSQLKKLLVALAASVAALFVNPFGYRLLLYPFDLVFRQASNLKNIQEWQSVDFNTGNGKLAIVLILGLLAVAWLTRSSWRLDEAALTAFALWGALSHLRLLFFAGLIVPPLLAPHVKVFTPLERKHDKPWLNAAIMATILGCVVYSYPSHAKLQRKIVNEYPTAVLAFLEQQHVRGRIFNAYKFGGYMEWYAPDLKPFIDGRADIFVYNGTFDDYIKVSRIEEPFEILDKYKIDYVLFEPKTPLSYLLDHNAGWQLTYADSAARLYQRVTNPATACLAKSPK